MIHFSREKQPIDLIVILKRFKIDPIQLGSPTRQQILGKAAEIGIGWNSKSLTNGFLVGRKLSDPLGHGFQANRGWGQLLGGFKLSNRLLR